MVTLHSLARSTTITAVDGIGAEVAELRAHVLAQAPNGHELIEIISTGRKNGDLTGIGKFCPTATTPLTSEGPNYASAIAALRSQLPEHHTLLHITAT